MHVSPDAEWNELYRRLELRLAIQGETTEEYQELWDRFVRRLGDNFSELLSLYMTLYGARADAVWHFEALLCTLFETFARRPDNLHRRDEEVGRKGESWFLDGRVIGAMCYVDRFSGTIAGLNDRLDYLQQLGISYLHLMPLFDCPADRNDGGYAVSSYRRIRPDLGTMKDLRLLADTMHRNNMRLVLDFVFNHTSSEHEWAVRASAGDPCYRNHYFLFPDRRLPDEYDRHLREIFPEGKPGSFVLDEESGQWVWSTFNPYQWDLNYGHPPVFQDMAEEMLQLANEGVDVLRLDALAFTWKQPGTSCENLPRAHTLIRLFRTVAKIVAPSLEFKSEAIVHPDDVVRYVDARECAISYNPLFMALSWEAVATRANTLLLKSLQDRFELPAGCTWVNYIRSHDDIGWTFADEDARKLGIDPIGHRSFLNHFYTARFEGSFARGLPFQLNISNGDCRVCGTAASLAGVEQAVRYGSKHDVELAVRRTILLHAMIFFTPGVPLLYLGDELGTLNDYSFAGRTATADDSRWVHRPRMNWKLAEEFTAGSGSESRKRSEESSPDQLLWNAQRKIHDGIHSLIRFRRSRPELGTADMKAYDPGSANAIAIERIGDSLRLIALFNLSEQDLELSSALSSIESEPESVELSESLELRDVETDQPIDRTADIRLSALSYRVFEAALVSTPGT